MLTAHIRPDEKSNGQYATRGGSQRPRKSAAEGKPVRSRTRPAGGKARQTVLQLRPRACQRRHHPAGVPLVDQHEIGHGSLQYLQAVPALPAPAKMIRFPGGELAVQFQQQLLIGEVGIRSRHMFHRSADRAIRDRERARDIETAPSEISSILAISR